MAVRTSGDASRLANPLRSAIQAMDLDLALYDLRTFQAAIEQSRLFFRVFAGVFTIFAATALLMAAIGLYAVMAQATTRRTREIGIRMALGATPARILATVMRRGAVQLAMGLVLGLALAFAATGTMETLLFGVLPHDPIVFATAAVVLVGVGLLACWLPARRAARIAPMRALAHEERA
jgi:ABC-type antimicrobial peptide transport system permease subunit